MAESLNICVVDDDRDVAEGLAEILELAGHQVQTAFSGQDALRILEQGDFDVAYLNACLPERTRLESFMELRSANPDMQAVMMTGYTIEQLLRQAVKGGSVSVLQRPVAMDEVLRALESAKPQGVVLVAEDDPEIRQKISETLALQDYRVGVARTVGDALDIVFANECDILVLDLRRPVIDALEVYLELEKHERALPTIVISEAPDTEGAPIDLLRDQTITGVLVKPFDPARLLATLGKMQRKNAEPEREEPVVECHHADGPRGRILVIDDDRDLAEGLADVLRDLGHTVEIAFSGSEALDIARRFDAQIALVDIKLGRASGLELISSLKELRPDIVNVVITANAGKESVIAALRSGAFDFLNKPMHPQDLFVILDRCFEHIRTQSQQAKAPAEKPSELVTHTSHELRDPLNAVIGFSEILGDEMMGPLGSDQYRHYAKGINQAGQHLTSVIDDMFETNGEGSQAPGIDEPQSEPAHGTANSPVDGQEPLAQPPSAGAFADLPERGETQLSGVGNDDPGTAHLDALPQEQDASSSVDRRYFEPAPPQTDSGWTAQDVPPSYQAASDQPGPDAPSGDSDPPLPREADPLGFEAAQRILEEAQTLAAGRVAVESAADQGDQRLPPAAMSGMHRDEAQPFLPASGQSAAPTADARSHMAGQPSSSEAETGGKTGPEHPSMDLPSPRDASSADNRQLGMAAPDTGVDGVVSTNPPAVDSITGVSQPDLVEDVEPGPAEEKPDNSELPHEEQEQNILKFSPFKKVI